MKLHSKLFAGSSALTVDSTSAVTLLQVYEMMLVRHSLMLIGPSGVGKSTIVQALHDAVSSSPGGEDAAPFLAQPHRDVRMNPKAITVPQVRKAAEVSCVVSLM